MADNHKRTEAFRWNTRWELYEYFGKNFNLTKKDIDQVIFAVMEEFKPRKGQAIRTSELWQKVGISLEKQHTPSIDVADLDE